MAVVVDVLGPLRVRAAGVEQAVTGRRERAVLGLLVAAGGRQVAVDRLVDEVWGEQPPASAAGSVQVAVSKLRKVLGHDAIVREPGGYALAGVEVDAGEFAALVQRAAAALPAAALDLTERALALWRGRPYDDLADVPGLAAEATRLGEDLLRLHETRAGALLDLGDAAGAQAGLAVVAAEHPFRERLWSLHALALYRCERQADALATLRTLRQSLDTELGIDPSPSVRALEEQILRQDPGLAGPAPAAPSTAPSTASTAPTLVGRDELLDRLSRHLDDLVAGRGGLVLLGGEAGIGKTALAEAVADRARAAGIDVARGRCHEGDLAPAYWPWLPVLRHLAEDAPDDTRVQALLGGDGSDEVASGPEAAGAATMRTFDAVARWLGRRADPLLVVLEDLHWADLTSLRLLAYVVEELRERPLLVVATSRPVDARRQTAHAQALAGLARLGAQRVAVPPLDAAGVGALVHAAGLPADRAAELAPSLVERCDGNAFFVLETVRLLAGGADLDDLEVPEGIADVLRLRVQRLDPATQEALGVAAVVGRDFDPVVLGAMLPAGRRPLDDLAEALAAGVVQETEHPGRLRFVHALARETLYRDLPVGRRAAGHAAAGRALAARLMQDPELLPEVAHHHLVAAAYLPEVAADAVRHASDAARAAERRGAFEEAAGLWDQAVAAERRAEPDPGAPTRRHDLLLTLALARQRLGHIAGMIAALDEAVALARHDDDVVRMAEAATGYRSSGVWHWREMGDDQPGTRAVLEHCLERVTDVGLQARLHNQLGLEHYVAWRHQDLERCAERAVSLARECGDPAVLRDCLIGRAVTLWAPGRAPERIAVARELLTVCDTAEYELAALCHLGTALHTEGDYATADEVLGRAYELADRLRFSGADLFLTWLRWLRALESDDPDAPAIAHRALERHRRTSMVGLVELAGLVVLEGEDDHAGVPPDLVAGARGHPHPGYRSGVAAALARAGRVEEALALVVDDDPVGVDYASMYGACRRLEVLAVAGHPALTEAVEALRPFAGTVATYGSVVSLGAVDLFLGIGLAALGDEAGARSAWEAARAMNERNGARRWVRRADGLLRHKQGTSRP